jgi:MarR family transcriptional regulator for hemolysin
MAPDLLKAISLLRRALSRAATASLAASGIGPRQLMVLRELRQSGPVSQVELARSTQTDPAGLMRAIDALEARGWVRRANSLQDRRSKSVSLTPEGQRAFQELDASYDALRGLADHALTAAERRQFSTLAAKLTAALDASGHGAAAPSQPVRARAAGRRTENR